MEDELRISPWSSIHIYSAQQLANVAYGQLLLICSATRAMINGEKLLFAWQERLIGASGNLIVNLLAAKIHR